MNVEMARYLLLSTLVVTLLTGPAECVLEDGIVFLDPTIRPPLPKLVFDKMPDCAKNSKYGLCEAPDTYPEDVLKHAIANSDSAAIVELSSGDELPIGNRFGGDTRMDTRLVEETAACVSAEALVYPRLALNSNDEWVFVANNKDAVQALRVEKCVNEGQECRIGRGEGTICRQKFIYRKMLALDARGKMAANNFRIPSCCACYIKNDFLVNRFNTRRNSSITTASTNKTKSPLRRPVSRHRRQTTEPELEVVGGETSGLSGSPLDNVLSVERSPEQGTAQQSIETEDTLNPSDTIGGQPIQRFAGEIVVHSQPILVERRPKQRRN